jgi:hypothetical protein
VSCALVMHLRPWGSENAWYEGVSTVTRQTAVHRCISGEKDTGSAPESYNHIHGIDNINNRQTSTRVGDNRGIPDVVRFLHIFRFG